MDTWVVTKQQNHGDEFRNLSKILEIVLEPIIIRVDMTEENRDLGFAKFDDTAEIIMTKNVQKVLDSYGINDEKIRHKTVKWFCTAIDKLGIVFEKTKVFIKNLRKICQKSKFLSKIKVLTKIKVFVKK